MQFKFGQARLSAAPVDQEGTSKQHFGLVERRISTLDEVVVTNTVHFFKRIFRFSFRNLRIDRADIAFAVVPSSVDES